MARSFQPRCKQCRREGTKLLFGERCASPKCGSVKRPYPPGQHGPKGRPRLSGYGTQLREKQKMKRMYRLLEAQFRGYYESAARKRGSTSYYFLLALERRLDNVVYRLGFSPSRNQARQYITHGHIMVNKRPVTIPSFAVRPGDALSIKPTSALRERIQEMIQTKPQPIPSWLSLDQQTFSGRVERNPEENEMNLGLEPQLIVEYYSR